MRMLTIIIDGYRMRVRSRACGTRRVIVSTATCNSYRVRVCACAVGTRRVRVKSCFVDGDSMSMTARTSR